MSALAPLAQIQRLPLAPRCLPWQPPILGFDFQCNSNRFEQAWGRFPSFPPEVRTTCQENFHTCRRSIAGRRRKRSRTLRTLRKNRTSHTGVRNNDLTRTSETFQPLRSQRGAPRSSWPSGPGTCRRESVDSPIWFVRETSLLLLACENYIISWDLDRKDIGRACFMTYPKQML